MKYNVGDKVRIKSKFHFCSVDGFNNINMKDEFFNQDSRLLYCETVMTIGIVNKDFYILKEDKWAYKWTDEMIECKVEEGTLIEKVDDNGLPFNEWLSHKGAFHIPEDYVLKDENGNEILTSKIILEKKKPKYPTNYMECYEVMFGKKSPFHAPQVVKNIGYKGDLFTKLQRLVFYRDAYWKIAGEEMGLGKPWEPDWTTDDVKYTISTIEGMLTRARARYDSAILAFPTTEMRDDFEKNFDPDIKICKEFL